MIICATKCTKLTKRIRVFTDEADHKVDFGVGGRNKSGSWRWRSVTGDLWSTWNACNTLSAGCWRLKAILIGARVHGASTLQQLGCTGKGALAWILIKSFDRGTINSSLAKRPGINPARRLFLLREFTCSTAIWSGKLNKGGNFSINDQEFFCSPGLEFN